MTAGWNSLERCAILPRFAADPAAVSSASPARAMSTSTPQAILGARTDVEMTVMIRWPSIACSGLGRVIGSLFEGAPARLRVIAWPLLALLLGIPLGLLLYLALKVPPLEHRFRLTTQNVQRFNWLGSNMLEEVSLDDIADIQVVQQSGQAFYKAADLVLVGSDDKPAMRLAGITRAEVFRQSILKARDARSSVQSSLAVIEARDES